MKSMVMTIEDLIKDLKLLPKDTRVVVTHSFNDGVDFSVKLERPADIVWHLSKDSTKETVFGVVKARANTPPGSADIVWRGPEDPSVKDPCNDQD